MNWLEISIVVASFIFGLTSVIVIALIKHCKRIEKINEIESKCDEIISLANNITKKRLR